MTRYTLSDLESFVMDTIDNVFLNDRPGQKEKVKGAKALLAYRFQLHRKYHEEAEGQ